MVCKHFKLSDYVRVPFKGMVFYVKKSKMPKFRLAIGRIASGVPHFQVEKILDRRVDCKGKFWYHVKWKFYSEDANSWTKVIDASALVEEYEKRIATLNRGAENTPDSGKDANMGGVAVAEENSVVADAQVEQQDAQIEGENEIQLSVGDNLIEQDLLDAEEGEAVQPEILNLNVEENATTESFETGSELGDNNPLNDHHTSSSSKPDGIETCALDKSFNVVSESIGIESQQNEEQNSNNSSSSMAISSCSVNEVHEDAAASETENSFERLASLEISTLEIAALNELSGTGLQDEDIIVIFITEKVVFERKVGRPAKKKRAKMDPFVVFKCGDCTDKSFANKGKAIRHALFHQEPSYPCRSPNCDQLFRFKHKMKEHYNRVHKNGMKY